MALEADDVRFTLNHSIELRSLAAGLVKIRVLILDVGAQVQLKGKIDCDVSQRIFETGTFHVDEANEPLEWATNTPIDIVLRLRRPIAKLYDDAEVLYQELFTDSESPLRHTEAWLLLEAMQETDVPGHPDASASFGIRTDWADKIIE